MPYDPTHVHADVATCLDDIARAVKGEEVRGSIYDAIELIDARSVQLETDARAQMQTTANNIMHAFSPRFVLYEETGTGYGTITGSQMYNAVRDKEPIIPYIFTTQKCPYLKRSELT